MNYCKNCKNKKEETMKFCNDCGIELIKYNQLEHECEGEKFGFKKFKKKIKSIFIGIIMFFVIFICISLLTNIGKGQKQAETPTPQDFLNEKEISIEVDKTKDLKGSSDTNISHSNFESEAKKEKDIRNMEYITFSKNELLNLGGLMNEWAYWSSCYEPTDEWVENVSWTMAQIMVTNKNIRNYEAPEDYKYFHEELITVVEYLDEAIIYYIKGTAEMDFSLIIKCSELINKSNEILFNIEFPKI